MIDPAEARKEFFDRFGPESPDAAELERVHLFRAPGRVNIIGEHTDYNDGFVLPVAIDRDTVIAARRRDDKQVHVYSANRKAKADFDLSRPHDAVPQRWINYIEGVARVLYAQGHDLCGADMLVLSDVPTGAGLSSSAALEISSALTLLRLSGESIDRQSMALAGQQAEHEYVGTMCGIMDQFISAMGEARSALLIDCRTLEAVPVPIDMQHHSLVIANSGVKHDLATSAYNERRAQCEEAVRILREVLPNIRALRDVSESEFVQHEHLLPEVLRRRARHVITENARTLAAASALREGDYELLSELMHASHRSLQSDYEVSAPELDLLVQNARSIPGVFGSRMTGGGFGGCTVSFVQRARVEEFMHRMAVAYRNATGRDLLLYNCDIVRGAEEITL